MKCRRCKGTGLELDHVAIGIEMRAKRVKAGYFLIYVANMIGVSFSYLSNLENGKRNWTIRRIEQYLEAIK